MGQQSNCREAWRDFGGAGDVLFLDVGVYSLWKSLSRSFVICTVFYMNVTLQKTSPKCPSGVPQQTAEPEWPQVGPGAPAFKKFPFQVFLKTIGL